jgi:hypothetical protein
MTTENARKSGHAMVKPWTLRDSLLVLVQASIPLIQECSFELVTLQVGPGAVQSIQVKGAVPPINTPLAVEA